MGIYFLYGDFARAYAVVMVLVVDHAELTWGHTMYLVLGVDDALIWACPF